MPSGRRTGSKKSKKCVVCKETVFKMEETRCLGKLWHESCFKCVGCKKRLNLHTYKDSGGQPHCTTCFGRSGSSAIGFGPAMVGNYEKAYAAEKKKKKKTSARKQKAAPRYTKPSVGTNRSTPTVRKAARRSLERIKKTTKPKMVSLYERKPPAAARKAPKPKKVSLYSTTKKKVARRPPPRRRPGPKKVSLVDKKPRSGASPKGTGSDWVCVCKKGISYRTKYLDLGSKTKYPKGPGYQDTVTAVEVRNGWLRVKHNGTEQYWLPTKLKSAGQVFKKKSTSASSIMSFFGGGFSARADGSEEEESEEEESEDEAPPPRPPRSSSKPSMRNASPPPSRPTRRSPPPRKKTRAPPKETSSGKGLFGWLGFGGSSDADAEGGAGMWECTFAKGVSYRTARDMGTKVTRPEGPQGGDVVVAQGKKGDWIRVRKQGTDYWLPTKVKGVGTIFTHRPKKAKKKKKKKKKTTQSWDEGTFGA